MINYTLNIYWCVGDKYIPEKYLNDRPAFKDFISVDGKWNNKKYAPYGYLYFREYDEYIGEIGDKVRYVFIADKNDKDNECKTNIFKNDCLTAFLYGGEIRLVASEPKKTESEGKTYADKLISDRNELDRMAFNTHIIWEGIGNLDYRRARLRFENSYYYNASISFVLSIPYKLYSVGITEDEPYEAARVLSDIISRTKETPDSPESKIISELAALEHRRWVIEKICEGARRLVDKNGEPEYNSCIERASIKKIDKNGKLVMHPCIVHSTSETPLSNNHYSDHNNWDEPSYYDKNLDELDKMSIELHRAMKENADEKRKADEKKKADENRKNFKKKKAKSDEIIKAESVEEESKGEKSIDAKLNDLIHDDDTDEVRRDFDKYSFCVKSIIEGSELYASSYESYEKSFLESVRKSGKDIESREKGISVLKEELFPLIEANQYRDYKKYDIDLVEHIPFILTGLADTHICMSLGLISGRYANNNDFFISVASATALYATKITYLYIHEAGSNLDVLEAKLKAIRNFFDYRKLCIDIEIVSFISDNEIEPHIESILKVARDNRQISEYRIIECHEQDDCIEKLVGLIEEINPKLFDGSSVLTSSELLNSKILDRIVDIIPYFEFDSYNKKFKNTKECEYLRYMPLSSFIQIDDMFALMNAQGTQLTYPGGKDIYNDLWSIYCGEAIGIADISLCARSWNKVCEILHKKEGGKANKGKSITNIDLKDKTECGIATQMLEQLNDKYIKILKRDNKSKNIISADIISDDARCMLEKAGNLLEIHTYFEACNSGWFDDVQIGYKVQWENRDVDNEFEIILTKGYRSIILECKSTKNLDAEFYLKLNSLADYFGIGCKKVLVGIPEIKNKGTKTQIDRGKQLGINTIYEKEELEKIGKRLKEIMEES